MRGKKVITKKILKSLTIFFFVVVLSFSNIPFYALSGLIDSYIKTQGVVDTIWLTQQENNADVVDKFASFRSVAERLEVQKARAAALFALLTSFSAFIIFILLTPSAQRFRSFGGVFILIK